MKFMTKTVAAAVLAGVSLIAQSASTSTGRYFVNGIIPNSQAVEPTLKQVMTDKRNSCGPTALLFLDNHYVRNYTGNIPPHLTTIAKSKESIDRLYGYLSQTTNTYTDLTQLKYLAQTKWGYSNVVRMAAANGIEVNTDKLITYLSQDVPVLAALRAGYVNNPVGNYGHIVILFAYNRMPDEFGRSAMDPNNTRNNDLIEFYEPYYGFMRTVPRKDIRNGKAFDMAGFAFLAVGR